MLFTVIGAVAEQPSGDVWAPFWLERDWWDRQNRDPAREKRLARHSRFLQRGLPLEYRDSHNPLNPTETVLFEGGAVYRHFCRDCHGQSGMGDGQSGLALSPSPALLAFLVETPSAVDGYLLWAISEGGASFGTDMPSFKDQLSRDDIWKVIVYMRAGFPPVK
ncbi:MAG: cytochrome c [Gammaproteobacteria bacterium]|nr:cytochrome c [Gammaproteobacteria bacterium]